MPNRENDYTTVMPSLALVKARADELQVWRAFRRYSFPSNTLTLHKPLTRQSIAHRIASWERDRRGVKESDPHIYNKVYNQLMNNAATPEDFGYTTYGS